MSQFFWKVKLRVLLDRLLCIRFAPVERKKTKPQPQCLTEWVSEALFFQQRINPSVNFSRSLTQFLEQIWQPHKLHRSPSREADETIVRDRHYAIVRYTSDSILLHSLFRINA